MGGPSGSWSPGAAAESAPRQQVRRAGFPGRCQRRGAAPRAGRAVVSEFGGLAGQLFPTQAAVAAMTDGRWS
jgi:hypothetical protein